MRREKSTMKMMLTVMMWLHIHLKTKLIFLKFWTNVIIVHYIFYFLFFFVLFHVWHWSCDRFFYSATLILIQTTCCGWPFDLFVSDVMSLPNIIMLGVRLVLACRVELKAIITYNSSVCLPQSSQLPRFKARGVNLAF